MTASAKQGPIELQVGDRIEFALAAPGTCGDMTYIPVSDYSPPVDVFCGRKPSHNGKHREVITGGEPDGTMWRVKVTWAVQARIK